MKKLVSLLVILIVSCFLASTICVQSVQAQKKTQKTSKTKLKKPKTSSKKKISKKPKTSKPSVPATKVVESVAKTTDEIANTVTFKLYKDGKVGLKVNNSDFTAQQQMQLRKALDIYSNDNDKPVKKDQPEMIIEDKKNVAKEVIKEKEVEAMPPKKEPVEEPIEEREVITFTEPPVKETADRIYVSDFLVKKICNYNDNAQVYVACSENDWLMDGSTINLKLWELKRENGDWVFPGKLREPIFQIVQIRDNKLNSSACLEWCQIQSFAPIVEENGKKVRKLLPWMIATSNNDDLAFILR